MIDFISDYCKNIETYPVQSMVEPGYLSAKLPEAAPYRPDSLEDILKYVNDCIVPGLTHWQSPNFFCYFHANASTAAATELESLVLDWIGQMLKLPSSFLFSGTSGGVLHGSTCEAAICTLAAARDKALKELGGLVPLFLCATIGTTASGAVDPIAELGKVAIYKLWLHIDAAYAGSACICPELRHYLDGVELANSISMNPHKWFLTNMDCCCLWIKEPKLLVDSLSTDPEYLRNKASKLKGVVDYKDWQISLSRRFRALKLWIVIHRHGLANLMYHIRTDISMAKRFEEFVAKDDQRFEIVVPIKLALVCFRIKPKHEAEGTEINCKLLDPINSSGRAFMTHAVVGRINVLWCAIGTTLSEQHHVDALWKLFQEKADVLLMGYKKINS
ncbi:hypothetical protein PTKIN_Ptkin01aG0362700 [Pterospermum kingtungense]